jgi:hypothetical protein
MAEVAARVEIIQPLPICPLTNAPHEWILMWGEVVCGHCGTPKEGTDEGE